MLMLNKHKRTEVAVRVFIESDLTGREFFDQYDSLRECTAAVTRLARSSLKQTQQDGIARQVGIFVVPPSQYDSMDGYDCGDCVD